MADLQALQEDLHEWRMRNFPDCTPNQQFLGMVEEMGEIAHIMLKHEQGIRNSAHMPDMEALNEAKKQVKDGIAALMIFTMGLCSLMGWDLTYIVTSTAVNEVMRRDWITYPKNGVSE